MLNLPPEPQDIILSLLDKEDLWRLGEASRAFRKVALLPLLWRYNISASQIYSGSVTLSGEAYFLVPMIYDIHPIHKLSIIPGKSPLKGITSALAMFPLIPAIRISSALYANADPNVAKLIAMSSRGFWGNPLVMPSSFDCSDFFFMPFLILFAINVFLVLGVVNTYLSLTWVYHRIFGPEWDRTARIAADLDNVECNSLCIQIISFPEAPQLILSTFTSPMLGYITISHLPTLSPAHLLLVKRDSGLNFPGLLGFIRRYLLLNVLTFEPGAIEAASLGAAAVSGCRGQITTLFSPTIYIPYILQMERSVAILTITSAVHGTELTHALSTIASAPDSKIHTLTLKLKRPGNRRQIFPWRANFDLETDASLCGVRHLALVAQFKFNYNDADAHGFPCWLGRFPALVSVEFRGLPVPRPRQGTLVMDILASRAGVGEWEGVYFTA
ncbi:hypothetical protein B0H19DRAFT_1257886 [Mycena capillaripes]|nr:hypothetical protein B0H19DRAFT_1257886 [Mycena capillaripes]